MGIPSASVEQSWSILFLIAKRLYQGVHFNAPISEHAGHASTDSYPHIWLIFLKCSSCFSAHRYGTTRTMAVDHFPCCGNAKVQMPFWQSQWLCAVLVHLPVWAPGSKPCHERTPTHPGSFPRHECCKKVQVSSVQTSVGWWLVRWLYYPSYLGDDFVTQ